MLGLLDSRHTSNVPTETVSDRALLMRYLSGDESAFTQLVARHAGLVSGVCRRVLGAADDVDDAFQATFLVLARKARHLTWQESIAGWLHHTARRTSLKLRSMTVRRRAKEAAAAVAANIATTDATAPPTQVALQELAEVLDQELAALGEKFREVLVLNQLEGLSRQEVSERLGIRAAAVKDRLERGREQLRRRLLRRGVSLSATALAAWLAPSAAQASTATLVAATSQTVGLFVTAPSSTVGSVPAAVTLAQGVLKMMGLEKTKSIGLFLATLLTAGGLAMGVLQDDPTRLQTGLRGQVVAVDRTRQPATVTVELDEYQTRLSLDLARQVRVWSAYEPAQLDALQPGSYVALRLADDHRTVNEVHIVGAQREVLLRAVDDPGSLTVENDDDAVAAKVQLAPDAIVRIGGLPARVDELRPGSELPLEFSTKGQVVNAIEADEIAELVLKGEVVSVDATARIVTLRGEDHDDRLFEGQLPVSGEAFVIVDGRNGKLEMIQPRSEFVLRLSADRKFVRAMRVTSPQADDDRDE